MTPKLVAEIGFSEWTPAGLLRHPRFLGLREDKPAREVRREELPLAERTDPFNFPDSPLFHPARHLRIILRPN